MPKLCFLKEKDKKTKSSATYHFLSKNLQKTEEANSQYKKSRQETKVPLNDINPLHIDPSLKLDVQFFNTLEHYLLDEYEN